MSKQRARSHTDQHFVPKSYLKAWCDPSAPATYEPFVHAISVDGTQKARRAPAKLFTSNNLYTLKGPDGSRDLVLEHGLKTIEDWFVDIRSNFLDERRKLPTVRHVKLMAFVAAAHNRTPRAIQHWASQMGRVLRVAEDARQALKRNPQARFPPPVLSDGPKMTIEELAGAVDEPQLNFMVPSIEAELEILPHLRARVLCTTNPIGFVTSDTPVYWHNPDLIRCPPGMRSPGLGQAGIRVTMPVSPRQCLLLTHGEPGIEYIDIPDAVVDSINWRTIRRASERFISRSAETRSQWFEPGVLPPEAWENSPEGKAAMARRQSGSRS